MTGDLIPRLQDSLQAISRELERDPHLASPHSKRTYSGALADFEAWRAGRPMTKMLVEEYAAYLQQQAETGHRQSQVECGAVVGAARGDLAAGPGADPGRWPR